MTATWINEDQSLMAPNAEVYFIVEGWKKGEGISESQFKYFTDAQNKYLSLKMEGYHSLRIWRQETTPLLIDAE